MFSSLSRRQRRAEGTEGITSAFNFDGQAVAGAALIVMGFNWCEPADSQTEMDMRTDEQTDGGVGRRSLDCVAMRGDMARLRGPSN